MIGMNKNTLLPAIAIAVVATGMLWYEPYEIGMMMKTLVPAIVTAGMTVTTMIGKMILQNLLSGFLMLEPYLTTIYKAYLIAFLGIGTMLLQTILLPILWYGMYMIGMIMKPLLPAIVIVAAGMFLIGLYKKIVQPTRRGFLYGMYIKAQAIVGRKVSDSTTPTTRRKAWTEVGRQELQHLKQCQLRLVVRYVIAKMLTFLSAIVTACMMWYAGCGTIAIGCILGFLYEVYTTFDQPTMRPAIVTAGKWYGRYVMITIIVAAGMTATAMLGTMIAKMLTFLPAIVKAGMTATVMLGTMIAKMLTFLPAIVKAGMTATVMLGTMIAKILAFLPAIVKAGMTAATMLGTMMQIILPVIIPFGLCLGFLYGIYKMVQHIGRRVTLWLRRPRQQEEMNDAEFKLFVKDCQLRNGKEDCHNVYDDETGGTPFNGDTFRREARAKERKQQYVNPYEQPPLAAEVSDDDSSDDDSSNDESSYADLSHENKESTCDNSFDGIKIDSSPPSSVPSTSSSPPVPAPSSLSKEESVEEEYKIVVETVEETELEKVANADAIDLFPSKENGPSSIPAHVSQEPSPPSSSVDDSPPSSVPSTSSPPPVPAPSSLSKEESVEEDYKNAVETFEETKENGPAPIPARVSREPSPPSSSVGNSPTSSVPLTTSSPVPVPVPSLLSEEEPVEEEYKIVVETVEEIELEKVVNADAIELFPSKVVNSDAIELFPSKENGPSPIPTTARVSPEPSPPTSSVDNSPPSPPSLTSASRQCQAPDESVQMEIEMRTCPAINEACAMEIETDLGNEQEYPIDTSEPMDVDEESSVYYMDTTEPMDFETTFSESEVMMDVSVFQ